LIKSTFTINSLEGPLRAYHLLLFAVGSYDPPNHLRSPVHNPTFVGDLLLVEKIGDLVERVSLLSPPKHHSNDLMLFFILDKGFAIIFEVIPVWDAASTLPVGLHMVEGCFRSF